MRLKAYILAADPTWIEASLGAYYGLVEEIVVSYDAGGCGWTGASIPLETCLSRLRAMDTARKLRFCPGQYARRGWTPMANDTYQRQCALTQVGTDADWILQIDTDELLPHPQALLDTLVLAERKGAPAVEWPMRVLYRRLRNGAFLEVCAADGSDRFDYPGAIAVRPGILLKDARRTDGAILRAVVQNDERSLQLRRPPVRGEMRLPLLQPSQAILHNSWARSPARIRAKIRSWGHSEGLRSWRYYLFCWQPAPLRWRQMRDFHPFARGLWPALKPCVHLTQDIKGHPLE